MKSPFRRPWFSAGGRQAVPEIQGTDTQKPETKTASGFAIVSGEGAAQWSGRSYAALARAGFMKNPVAYRAVRMIAEAAAAVP
ncbi:phage portal protein, partial [Neorhizobium sp. BETTINA12A]|nr:phage portal protein [Neorhizobium sp. BETTINA12A]